MSKASPAPMYSAGTAALDLVLGGGLHRGSTVIFTGLPGTGKTVLAQQTIFANATPQRRALYLTTFSEPLAKVVRYLERFDFYDETKMHSSVVYRDLGKRLRESGVESLPDVLDDLVARDDFAIVVIDSLKALHDLGAPTGAFRLAIFDAAARSAALDITSIWLGEYGLDALDGYPEFAVADGIVELRNTPHGVRSERSLRVLKMRGAAPLPGEHTFTIGPSGLEVFPRLVAAEDIRNRPATTERMRTGVDGLDTALGGGLYRGTSTLVLGAAGTGKTTLALSVLMAGARAGEPGLLLTLQESPRELVAMADSIVSGEPLALAQLHIVHESPVEVDLVRVVLRLKREIEERGVRRLVIDALGDLRDAAIDPRRLRAVIYELINYCSGHGVTVLMNADLTLAGDHRAEDAGIPTMVDNVLILHHGTSVAPATVTVLKERRTAHTQGPQPFFIDGRGFHVGAP